MENRQQPHPIRRETDQLLVERLRLDAERFERIENKLDKLADAVIAMARAEEKLIQLDSDRTNTYNQLSAHAALITELTRTQGKHDDVINGIKKIFWTAFTSVAASGFGLLVYVLFNVPPTG